MGLSACDKSVPAPRNSAPRQSDPAPERCDTLDDNNPCTGDACDPALGATHTPLPLGSPCSEASACSAPGFCTGAGVCAVGPPPSFDDHNPCSVDRV